MKKFITMLVLASALAACDQQIDSERQQRLAAEKQAAEKEQSKNGWEAIAFFFCFGSVILLTVGTALGSAARKNGKPRD